MSPRPAHDGASTVTTIDITHGEESTTMKTRTAKRSRAALAVLAGLSLALTACGSSNDASNSFGGDAGGDAAVTQEASETSNAVVYEFEEARVNDSDDQTVLAAVEQPLVVRLSDELKTAVEADGGVVAVKQFTITAKSFSTGMCRVDVDVDYSSDDAFNTVAQRLIEDEHARHEGVENYNFDDEQDVFWKYVVDTHGEAEIVESVPEDSELSNSNTSYVTSDYSHATIVKECDDLDDEEVAFPYYILPSRENINVWDIAASLEYEIISGVDGGATIYATKGYANADLSISGDWAPIESD
ncbi:hypothetical protein [Actinomyces sp. 565]|uniref:hypothetical protein n=1 Tax=Actinomyces sp. 565 TaxID=2057794 RepID=UPI0013A6D5AB|nr:hypothetical protein [Actinomyces sp. 565]NDR52723.1 hypothetical protein [Actinomyces sp. 565]